MKIEEVYETYKHFSSFIHDIKKTQIEIDNDNGFTENLINHVMCDCFIAIEEEVKSNMNGGEKLIMPDKDGKGPRKRSYRPSVKKGGRKKGNCK